MVTSYMLPGQKIGQTNHMVAIQTKQATTKKSKQNKKYQQQKRQKQKV